MADESSNIQDAMPPTSPTVSSPRSPNEAKRWTSVFVMVILMNASWVFMGEALQGVEDQYHGTLVLVSMVAMSYAYCFIPWGIWAVCREREWLTSFVTPASKDIEKDHRGAFSWKSYFILTGWVSLISITCRATWYYSLSHTNAAANSAIFQTSSAWVYVFSLGVLGEVIDYVKITALVLGIGGSAMVAVFNSSESEKGVDQNIFGYFQLLLSVLTYALFQVAVKKYGASQVDPHPQMNSLRLCGMCGLWAVFWCPIMVFVGHISGAEKFTVPSKYVTHMTVSSGFVDAIFTGAMLICIRLTDPTFTSVSTILTVPLTVIADLIIHAYFAPVWANVGTVIVIIGCSLYNYRVWKLKKIRDKETKLLVCDNESFGPNSEEA